jgi:PAS domain S-box-containing protein
MSIGPEMAAAVLGSDPAAPMHGSVLIRHLLESLPAAIYTCDLQGRIQFYNQAAVDLWGRAPEIGKDLWCGSWRIFNLDDTPMPLSECPMAIAIREQRAVLGHEIVVERPDGRRRRVLPYPRPLVNSTGEIIGAVNMLVDITEQRRGDDARDRLAAIVDSSEDAIISKSVDGIIRSWNDAAERLFGYTAEEAIGKSILMIMPPDRIHEESEIQEKLHRGERVEHFETVRRRKDGSLVDLSLTISPIRDSSGRITGGSKIARDITGRRKAEQKMANVLERERHARQEAQILVDTVKELSGELDLQNLVQKVTDAGTLLIGAQFGSFFYNVQDERGESYQLFTLSGAPREAFEKFGPPRNTAVFGPTFRGEAPIRSDDIQKDPRYGHTSPHFGLPRGHRPVHSYLAAPVISRTGKVHGGLFFGHERVGVFTEQHERLIVGMAAQAAVAIDNAQLFQQAQREIAERTRAESLQNAQMRVLELISEDAPLEKTLGVLMRALEAHSGDGMLGSVLLLAPDGKHLLHGAAPSLPEAYSRAIHGTMIGPKAGSCGTAAHRGRAVHVSDITADPLWSDFRALALAHGLRACWSTPIFSREGQLLGTFAMYYRQPRAPREQDLALVRFATQTASLAIERKRSSEALRQAIESAEAANRAKDRFLAVLSHELRTPLSPVAMAVSAMEADADLPFRLRNDLAMIRRNVDLEARLIDDLLDLSRVTNGKLQLRLERVHLHEIVQHVLQSSERDFDEKRLNVQVQLDAATDRVRADPARLQQVVWNLVRNAVKFTPDGGQITIRTWSGSPPERSELSVGNSAGRGDRAEGGTQQGTENRVSDDASPSPGLQAVNSVFLEVRDSGIGIDSEILPRIFDAFEQGEQVDPQRAGQGSRGSRGSQTARSGGLGLGLAIARAIIERHGGMITASSDGPGKGASFILALDVLNQPSAIVRAGESGEAEEEKSPVSARILLVEDHLDSAQMLARLLKSGGYAVTTAVAVNQALELASANEFDVLVSDIGLPDGTGYELMQKLNHRVKGIALSGYGMEEDIRKSQAAGFAEHMVKPISAAALQTAIERLTGRGKNGANG